MSWLSWFFDDLFYWIALIALFGGAIAYVLSNFIGYIPMLKSHAMICKVVGLLLVLSGGYYVADHHGYERRVAEDKAEIDRLNTEARAKEVELSGKLAVANGQLRKAKNEITNKQNDLNSRADSGGLRLCPSSSVQASSSASSGDGASESESERQTIKALISIAADGDAAIVSYNSCLAQYETVRQMVNEGVK